MLLIQPLYLQNPCLEEGRVYVSKFIQTALLFDSRAAALCYYLINSKFYIGYSIKIYNLRRKKFKVNTENPLIANYQGGQKGGQILISWLSDLKINCQNCRSPSVRTHRFYSAQYILFFDDACRNYSLLIFY